MFKLVGLAVLAASVAACGQEAQKVERIENAAAAEYTFNDDALNELSLESSALPAAMIVRVPVLADGTEVVAEAELRAANTYTDSIGAATAWDDGLNTVSPAADNPYLVVNPPTQGPGQGQGQVQTPAPKLPLPKGKGKGYSSATSLADRTTASGAIAIGNRGVIVSGNYTSVGSSNGYDHNLYGAGYSARNGRGYSNPGYTNPGYSNRGHSNSSWYSTHSTNNYYNTTYRPVYRSRYTYTGRSAYWGYYGRPTRHIVGNHCYYVYPRPTPYCRINCF